MDLFTPTCGGCVHYQGEQDGAQGTCWRFPPTPVPVMQPQPATIALPDKRAPQGPGFGVVSVRAPVMVDTPACGEFETPEDDDDPGATAGGTE